MPDEEVLPTPTTPEGTQPTPTTPAATAAPAASDNMDDLVEELIEAAPVIPEGTGAQVSTVKGWEHVRDKYGNAFDPVKLHQVHADGSPVVSRTGKAMAKYGVKLPRPSKVAKAVGTVKPSIGRGRNAPAPTVEVLDRLDLEDDEDDEPRATQSTMTQAERETLAQMDAEELAEAEDFLQEIVGGPKATLTAEERAQLVASAKRWFIQDDVTLPIRARGLHLLRLTRITARRVNTPEGWDRLKRAWKKFADWINTTH